jgi:hypothetical protein
MVPVEVIVVGADDIDGRYAHPPYIEAVEVAHDRQARAMRAAFRAAHERLRPCANAPPT